MNNSIPVSLLVNWPERGYATNAFVKINNWYLPFETETVGKLHKINELQLRERMYARILKKAGLA